MPPTAAGTSRSRLGWLRSRRGIAGVVAAVVVAALIAFAVANSGSSVRVTSQFIAATPEGNSPVRLDTSLYLPATTPAPAVLLAQGFGGDKSGLDTEARTLAGHGYVVLTYSARGFGQSGGLIHFDSPAYEVKDAKDLVSWLAARPEVAKAGGNPQVAVAGSSYGGGLALLLAAYDPRIDAVAADITWNDLTTALFPNDAGAPGPLDRPGVFKRLWVGELFGNGFQNVGLLGSVLGGSAPLGASTSASAAPGDSRSGVPGFPGTRPSANAATQISCGRFAPAVCHAYQASAEQGEPTAALRRYLAAASPSRVLDRITAPTLLTQGEQDSLFPLSQADANARGLAANGTPVKVVWRPGGHDNSSLGGDVATSQMIDWFDAVFSGRIAGAKTSPGSSDSSGGAPTAQPFQFAESSTTVSSDSGEFRQRTLVAPSYPDIGAGDAGAQPRTVDLFGPAQTISAPADGTPAAITALPGLGAVLAQFGGSFGAALSVVPAQTAVFGSAELGQALLDAGGSTVRLRVTAHTSDTATLFLGLRDVAGNDPSSATLPEQLVAPIRLTGLTPGHATTVTVHLPWIVHTFPSGHRLVLTVSTTDFAYQLPQDAREYTVALAAPALTVPTIPGAQATAGGNAGAWLIAGGAVVVLLALLVAFELRRRRRVVKPRPDLRDVPVAVTSLVKEYRGGYRAVDDVSFQVRRGQVVGLLGPNGAGKTTVMRVLVGLITPTSGTVHVFGEPITPGASVLARVGAFIEGPGFLPHLSGRDNLRLYWEATGRPAEEAEFETALQIAGLGSSIDRKVKAYSQGMRQRLGIAQAMLALPELLVLDEPTNGLDPPQIAEMREVLQRYAETGRTVVVSSHLLAEVEQTCTHVVVMHKGRLVAAGSVMEIAGAGGSQLAVPDAAAAAQVLADAGIDATLVPARRALEDVFLDLIGADQ